MQSNQQKNPFTVTTPEGLDATEAKRLFVDVFTDFFKVRDPGHSILNGPRGSGKSMMFRYLEPDCQCLEKQCEISDLDFFAVLISIKNAEVNPTDIRRIESRQYRVVLNEHLLSVYIAGKVFSYMSELSFDAKNNHRKQIADYVSNEVMPRMVRCGLPKERVPKITARTSNNIFEKLGTFFDDLCVEVVQFAKRLPPLGPEKTFDGPLCGYLDFLFPVLKQLKLLSFMPSGPIYLLLDDADVLGEIQTRILNTWIGTRTSGDVSLKLSTQERYKTFAKVSGGMIECPHDYSEVNIADLYTTNRGKFLSRMKDIVRKRLLYANIDCEPDAFFPCYAKQEEGVKKIAMEILAGEHDVSGKGYRLSDDVVRYARPIYMKSLSGARKSSSQYLYAGFSELVHISSGLIRYFLEPAALMFSEQQASQKKPVKYIEPRIQHDEVQKMSIALMTSEFDKIVIDPETIGDECIPTDDGNSLKTNPFLTQKQLLKNLLLVLGGTFRQKLLSSDSERRVFSIAFSDVPIPEIESVFELGVAHSYFQKSTIGNKDGTGRTNLYVMTRRLAPFFRLDPSGFAGYLFVQSSRLYEAIQHPDKTLRRIQEKGDAEVFGESRQLVLPYEESEEA